MAEGKNRKSAREFCLAGFSGGHQAEKESTSLSDFLRSGFQACWPKD